MDCAWRAPLRQDDKQNDSAVSQATTIAARADKETTKEAVAWDTEALVSAT